MKITSDLITKVIELSDEGKSIFEISKLLNIKEGRVNYCRVLHRKNADRRRQVLTEDAKQFLDNHSGLVEYEDFEEFLYDRSEQLDLCNITRDFILSFLMTNKEYSEKITRAKKLCYSNETKLRICDEIEKEGLEKTCRKYRLTTRHAKVMLERREELFLQPLATNSPIINIPEDVQGEGAATPMEEEAPLEMSHHIIHDPNQSQETSQMEEHILNYIQKKIFAGEGITLVDIVNEAQRVGPIIEGPHFETSLDWAQHLVKRHNFKIPKELEKPKPVDPLIEYWVQVDRLIFEACRKENIF